MSAEIRTSAGDKLAASVLTFLRRYPPFDKLEPDALEFMARRARSSRWGRASAFPWARCWKSVP